MSKKIRVNKTNSKVLAGKLFITELKALLVSKSKVLAELIEYDNNIVFKGTKLVEYNGPYIRLKA
tara:strand:+ start:97 stop:291 length:195 start_codon:yes stop_codon:yes gene_type:complete